MMRCRSSLARGHSDVEQAPLFFQFFGSAGAKFGWNAAVDNIEDEDRFALLAFRRMDRRQDQVVLIEQWDAGRVTGGTRRIERKCSQKGLARRITAGELFKLS
jgi:hypothetical protein